MKTAVDKFLVNHPFDIMRPNYPDWYTGEDWDDFKGRAAAFKVIRFWDKIVDKCEQNAGVWHSITGHSLTRDRADYLQDINPGLEIRLKDGYLLVRVVG